MSKRERAKEVLSWLIYAKKLSSQKELAELMNYSPTVVSSAMTGKIPLSDKLVRRICSMDDRLNPNWIMEGTGEMLRSDNENKASKAAAKPESPAVNENPLSDQMKNLVQTFAAESEKKDRKIKDLEQQIADLQDLVTFLLKKGGAEALNAVLGSEHLATAATAIARLAK